MVIHQKYLKVGIVPMFNIRDSVTASKCLDVFFIFITLDFLVKPLKLLSGHIHLVASNWSFVFLILSLISDREQAIFC